MTCDTCHVSDTWLENSHVSRLYKVRGSESGGGNQFDGGKEREKGKREMKERKERKKEEGGMEGEEGDRRFLPRIYDVLIVRILRTKE